MGVVWRWWSGGKIGELQLWRVAPGVKFCAGEGGLRSWEWCGGGGVEGKMGESGVKGMAGKTARGAGTVWGRVMGNGSKW
nr:hypothetical protein [Tanacetum cinerariifolium]